MSHLFRSLMRPSPWQPLQPFPLPTLAPMIYQRHHLAARSTVPHPRCHPKYRNLPPHPKHPVPSFFMFFRTAAFRLSAVIFMAVLSPLIAQTTPTLPPPNLGS